MTPIIQPLVSCLNVAFYLYNFTSFGRGCRVPGWGAWVLPLISFTLRVRLWMDIFDKMLWQFEFYIFNNIIVNRIFGINMDLNRPKSSISTEKNKQQYYQLYMDMYQSIYIYMIPSTLINIFCKFYKLIKFEFKYLG